MTITNHILAGSIIGAVIPNQAVAIGLAFTSHFAMDIIPHFGYSGNKGYSTVLQHKFSYFVGWLTLITTILVLSFLIYYHQWFPLFTGIIAALPDAFGLYNWLAYEKYGKHAKGFLRLFHVVFHRKIQWCERPWGIIIEGIVTTLLSIILYLIILKRI